MTDRDEWCVLILADSWRSLFVFQLSQQQQEEPRRWDAIAHAVPAALSAPTPHR